MTNVIDHNILLRAGDRLKDIITEAQAKFSRAILGESKAASYSRFKARFIHTLVTSRKGE
jgi:hypothetical protein